MFVVVVLKILIFRLELFHTNKFQCFVPLYTNRQKKYIYYNNNNKFVLHQTKFVLNEKRYDEKRTETLNKEIGNL